MSDLGVVPLAPVGGAVHPYEDGVVSRQSNTVRNDSQTSASDWTRNSRELQWTGVSAYGHVRGGCAPWSELQWLALQAA